MTPCTELRLTRCSGKCSHQGCLANAGAALQEHAALELQRTQHAQRVLGGRGGPELECCALMWALMGSSLYKKWRDAPGIFRLCGRGALCACAHTLRASGTTALILQRCPVITHMLNHGLSD